ncbi:hypothetical protein Tco_0840934 [Tanacetum coccineum]|uniref:Uncharacterized protein n=1 Tax=Tanacetum coccineum TaxID=301880 RepID=A0ABQ5AXM9_9ASTR
MKKKDLQRGKAEKEQEQSIFTLIETWMIAAKGLMLIISWLEKIEEQEQKSCSVKKGYKLNDLKLKDFDSIQEMFDRAFKRVNTFEDFRTELVEGKEKRAGTELAQEITKKQKVEDDKEIAEIKKLMEIIPDEEEVAIDVIPLAVKSPSIVD